MNETRYILQVITDKGEAWSYPMRTKEDAECAAAVLSSVKQLGVKAEVEPYDNNGFNESEVFVDMGALLGFHDEIFRGYCAYLAKTKTLDQTLDDTMKHIKEITL